VIRKIAAHTAFCCALTVGLTVVASLATPGAAQGSTRQSISSQRSRTHRVARMRYVRAPYPGAGTAPMMEAAIRSTWPDQLEREAMNVAWCESRGEASARNGQYRGHFQMGRSEWARYGAGNPYNPVDNAAAAYRYFQAAGSWRPWQCQP